MLQPGFEPDIISLRPARPRPYSQGLRNPSRGLLLVSRWSFSSEITPARVCALAVSWVLEDGRLRKRGMGSGKDAQVSSGSCR